MANPLVIIGTLVLLAFGGGVVTHSIIDDEATLNTTLDEVICDYNQWHQQTFGDDDEWIEYYNENCQSQIYQQQQAYEEQNGSNYEVLDLNTWSPLQLSIGFGLLFAVLFQRRR